MNLQKVNTFYFTTKYVLIDGYVIGIKNDFLSLIFLSFSMIIYSHIACGKKVGINFR